MSALICVALNALKVHKTATNLINEDEWKYFNKRDCRVATSEGETV